MFYLHQSKFGFFYLILLSILPVTLLPVIVLRIFFVMKHYNIINLFIYYLLFIDSLSLSDVFPASMCQDVFEGIDVAF
jgi:hypothetical protein